MFWVVNIGTSGVILIPVLKEQFVGSLNTLAISVAPWCLAVLHTILVVKIYWKLYS